MRRMLPGLVLAAGALAACNTDIQSGIDSANDLLYQKQYVASERLYQKLLKRVESDKKDLDETEAQQRLLILERLGKINALYLHDYKKAIHFYELLVRHYPEEEQAFNARATVADLYHHKLGDPQAAIEWYQRLVSEFPERPETRRAQLQISSAYFQMKNYEQARTEAEGLITRWPTSPEAAQARFQIANSYYVQARYAEAIATYERLLEDKPQNPLGPLVLFELGNCFQELGESERALAYYYACLSDHPNPTLVQRKIQRVRKRLHRTRPSLTGIDLPDYLQERLAAAGHPVEGNVYRPTRPGKVPPRAALRGAGQDKGPRSPSATRPGAELDAAVIEDVIDEDPSEVVEEGPGETPESAAP